MHCAQLTPTCYSATATITLGLFAVYGAIGNILYFQELFTFPYFGDWPFNQRFTIYLMMAINTCYILAAALGLFAFISQRIYTFFWSSFILMGSFAVQLIHGVACVRASYESMDVAIFSTFRNFQNDPTFTSWLLDFQWQYDCCGIKSYMDWQLFNTQHSNNYSVPDSCCDRKKKIPFLNCGTGLLAPNVSVDTASGTINILGCGNKIAEHYQGEIRAKGIIMLLVAFISLCVGAIIFIAHQKIENRQYGGGRARRSTAGAEAQRQQRVLRSNSQRNQNQGNAGSSNFSSNHNEVRQNQRDINGNPPKVPSYYKVNVAHKPPTGRTRPPRKDSTRNFQTKNTPMQKNGPKHRANPYQKHKYNNYNQNLNNPNNRAFGIGNKSRRGQTNNNNEFLKTKLEMLMHPIQTYSTSSATPNSSDLFPFYTAQPSTSVCGQASESVDFDPRSQLSAANRYKNNNNNNTADLKLAHYNSLPQVVTFPDGRVETLYHFNTSHVHAQKLRRKHSQRSSPIPNFNLVGGGGGGGGGKSKFPSLTITSTLATIHEENESVKSGNSQASSTCTTNASSSPKSLSKSSSHQIQAQSYETPQGYGYDNSQSQGVDGVAVLNELQRTAQDMMLQQRGENKNEHHEQQLLQHQLENHISSNISSDTTATATDPSIPNPTTRYSTITKSDDQKGDNYSSNMDITVTDPYQPQIIKKTGTGSAPISNGSQPNNNSLHHIHEPIKMT